MKQHFRYGPPMHRVAVHHAKGNGGSRTHTAAPLLKAASFRSSTQTCQMNRTRAPARIGRTPPPPSHSPTPFSRHSTTQRSRRALEDDPGVPSATHSPPSCLTHRVLLLTTLSSSSITYEKIMSLLQVATFFAVAVGQTQANGEETCGT